MNKNSSQQEQRPQVGARRYFTVVDAKVWRTARKKPPGKAGGAAGTLGRLRYKASPYHPAVRLVIRLGRRRGEGGEGWGRLSTRRGRQQRPRPNYDCVVEGKVVSCCLPSRRRSWSPPYYMACAEERRRRTCVCVCGCGGWWKGLKSAAVWGDFLEWLPSLAADPSPPGPPPARPRVPRGTWRTAAVDDDDSAPFLIGTKTSCPPTGRT